MSELRTNSSSHSSFYTRVGKRSFDLVTSFAGLIFLGPLLLLVAVAVRITSPGPAFFLQTRIGRFAEPFRIIKFRTMCPAEAGSPLLTAANDSRITIFGRWLRKTKIDELPQLFNVLIGEMSLVGPRPEVPLYAAKYSEAQQEVFQARPGITGPSIILNEEELMAAPVDKEKFYMLAILPAKLEVDMSYCRDIRFGEDLRLVFLTLARLGNQTRSDTLATGTIQHLGRP